MKRLSAFITALAIATASAVATDYNVLATKADRFYRQQEWASASAMYDLMLDRQPDVAGTYCRAIVSAAMRNDTTAQLALMDKALQFHVPFDSVFTTVERESFAIGQGQLYEDFLYRVKHATPWLSRSINAYLLRYYTFRRNAAKMIEFSKLMLSGMPDDTGFLTTLAQGYMLDNRPQEAIDTYRHILQINPDDYNSLLETGNYYYMLHRQSPENMKAREEALLYLKRAAAIHPTPYVATVIAELENTDKGAK